MTCFVEFAKIILKVKIHQRKEMNLYLLAKRKTKNFSSICKALAFSLLISFTTQYQNNNICANAEEMIDNFTDDNKLVFEYKNRDKISILVEGNKILITKSNSELDIWSNEVEMKDNLYFNNAIKIEELGFILINNYCTNSSHKDIQSNKVDKIHVCEDSLVYNLIAFNSDGQLLLSEDTDNISKEYLEEFVEDVFMIKLSSFEEDLDSLSQEDLYNRALELISIAEKSLNGSDIEKANLAISKIVDNTKRESLIKKLNIISNESIDKEVESSDLGVPIINDIASISTSSGITLSVDTNNITFDYLNISDDTTIHKAITLDVTSSLPYDINMYIEGGITSNTNGTNLNNNVFSVKESSSSNFLTFDDSGVVTVLSNSPAGAAISHSIDVRLNTSKNIIRDVYKTVFKIEAITK